MDVVSSIRPPLPDLVIHQILQILPTKADVRMSFLSKQWDGVWCSTPVLDFDEGDDPGKYDNDHIDLNKILEHRKFINVVEKWLEFCEQEQQKQVFLNKFRLRMMRYVPGDYGSIDKCLSYVFERNVKELDISLRISRLFWGFSWQIQFGFDYCISRTTLANAKTLTVLKLEYVRIKNHRLTKKKRRKTPRLLPNLKTMYLKNVHFDELAPFYLILECPSIQDLSLTSCHCENSEFDVSSSSLKSLEIEHCDSRIIYVDEAKNLESFTVSSNSSLLEKITLIECSNLKYINVHAEHLKRLTVSGHDCLKGTINTPNLVTFGFEGFSKSKILVKAPNLKVTRVFLSELRDRDVLGFNGSFRHFSTLRDFLENIGFSKRIVLYVRNYKALLFPEDFRKNFSSPLYGVKHLVVVMPNSQKEVSDIPEFRHALGWMAPSTNQLSLGEENHQQFLAHCSLVGL
ncbi:PREDICTED: putative FBD-associated F-box protein At5g22720 [Fragaria vesca subsp. vesca]|uniref:putative FBD-associated F-box protein At5g22720 n=1 Tax=Fragaria vesca subsp. vesca TaxID=101020 RepID=UPI0002C3645D|nr:PREDICTED: putative FBD-associated F-box protein At5g22720 [Fragaria vesca subsp. vesca]